MRSIGLAVLLAIVLPNGWIVTPPDGASVRTGTMPQGAAASPDGTTIAVVESGYNAPALRLYRSSDLHLLASSPLKGAFGRPLWRDATHVLVAGANADAIFELDLASKAVRTIALSPKSYPVALALSRDGTRVAVATDGERGVRIGTLESIASAPPVRLDGHPAGVAFSDDGATLFAAVRQDDRVVAISTHDGSLRTVHGGLHPTDLLVAGNALYVAQSDADTIGVYDVATFQPTAQIFVGSMLGTQRIFGSSPNALARSGNVVYASLGAANAVATIEGNVVTGRIPTGWYPTDVVPIGDTLIVVNGKGEGMPANPRYVSGAKEHVDYIGTIQFGSLRTIAASARTRGNAQRGDAVRVQRHPVVRAHGPIRHVFFVLKENRTYDQVLGDLAQGNGDRSLVWFGRDVTPNQHALAQRFGLFDNTYTSGEVSDPGHDWADAAFANDYVERFWPLTYGGRRDEDDLASGTGASSAHDGYIWDAARRAGVTFRDYGEMSNAPGLGGRVDPRYVGWDLTYSDLDRLKEWRGEFNAFMRARTLPQLEYIWLPNDHTSGTRAGRLTPIAYVAQNDYAVGQLVDTISHSPVWRSSAIFIIEDDAQDGADHVSAQRTTAYVISPYARGGVNHTHYATVNVLRTMELMLGIAPLSAYDATALPMYDAFRAVADLRPYTALAPRVSITARNAKTAYGAQRSARMDFTRPDAAPHAALLDVLAHAHQAQPLKRLR